MIDVKKIIKTLIVFLCYLVYAEVIGMILSPFGMNSIYISFIADAIFMVGIIFAYKDNLKKDFASLKKDYKNPKTKKFSFKKLFLNIIKWVAIIFVFNIIMGIFTDLLFPNASQDANTSAVFALKDVSLFYTVFKAMIFAVVAEELLFRESIRDSVSHDFAFIIISSIIYTMMNFIFTGLDGQYILLDILSYFLPALLFSTAYVKNKSNILVFMMIKFVYNLVPLTILLLAS